MSEWVVSLSGERGKGPWDRVGTLPAKQQHDARKFRSLEDTARIVQFWMSEGHPRAKAFRLVRKPKATRCALRDAVVEAADQWEEGYSSFDALGEKYAFRRAALAAAVRALRAHERGE